VPGPLRNPRRSDTLVVDVVPETWVPVRMTEPGTTLEGVAERPVDPATKDWPAIVAVSAPLPFGPVLLPFDPLGPVEELPQAMATAPTRTTANRRQSVRMLGTPVMKRLGTAILS
jgi:hypothetical protein